ncbi:hypothetical protein NDU88_005061 [Pleurodeles waltl]|uniref:Uncharacterized protein n=1 Tax=Pleurodeles waltl TaxID=8319 RepID=A0AAV7LKB8_PLEWA|nr:hypothetical protein NDU88_005061 [Pleurodeles waltl]
MRGRGPPAFRPPRILRGGPGNQGSAHAAEWRRRAGPARRGTAEGERGGAGEPLRGLQQCRPDPKAWVLGSQSGAARPGILPLPDTVLKL